MKPAFMRRLSSPPHNGALPPFFMQPLRLLVTALALACALPLAHAADQERARQGVVKGVYKPLSAIMADIARQHPGRVVDVETQPGARGELRYEITLIDAQGRKQELLVDAATGQVVTHAQTLAQRAANLAELAAHLRRVEQQQQRRVIDAEFEITRQGQPVYELKLAPAGKATQRLRIDARTGQALDAAGQPAAAASPLHSMPDMLSALSARYSGLVSEVELENGETPHAYYELELLQENGAKLELRVDARTLAVRERGQGED